MKGPDSDDYECEENRWNSYEYEQWVGTWQDEVFDAEDLKNAYFKDMCEWFVSDINKAIKSHFKEAE